MGSGADPSATSAVDAYPCPLCGGTQRTPIREVAGYGRCAGCGLVCNDSAEPPEAYAGDYFTADEPGAGHRDFESGAAARYDEVRFGQELERIGPPVGRRRLLDVGSATGSFLRIAARHGWTGVGVEISGEARAIAARSGVDSRPELDDVEDLAPFELITLHHVLEHLADPVGTLARLRSLLAPGGRMVVEVPNWRSLERRSMGPRWMDLRPNQHRWHWDPDTLRRACDTAGLRVVRLTAPGEPIPSVASVLRSLGVPERWAQAGRELKVGRLRRAPHTASACGPVPASGDVPGGAPLSTAVDTVAGAVDAVGSRLLLGKRLVAEAVAGDSWASGGSGA